MYYVYLIRSRTYPRQHYTGFTEELSVRISDHNAGKSFHTAKFRPWRLVMYFVFTHERQAKEFECYLKTGSGRVFLKRHFLDEE